MFLQVRMHTYALHGGGTYKYANMLSKNKIEL